MRDSLEKAIWVEATQPFDDLWPSPSFVRFSYAGDFTEAVLNRLIPSFRAEFSSVPTQIQRDLFAVFVELFQNIARYGQAPSYRVSSSCCPAYHREGGAHASGFICVFRQAERLYMRAANLITHEQEQILQDRLDRLKDKNPEQLGQAYKERLALLYDQTSHIVTSQLGLIDVAYRTKAQFSYTFTDRDNGVKRFVMTLCFS